MGTDNRTVMEAIDESIVELKDRLVRLTDQLHDVEARKKAANAGFNDEIKDLKETIKAVMVQIKDKEQDDPGLLG